MPKTKKKIILAIALLSVFGVIIVLGLYQNQLLANQNQHEYTVEEYFEVTVAMEPMGEDRYEKNGTVMIIHGIWVGVKAIKGDAYEVFVESWAGSEELQLGDIPKGQVRRDLMVSYTGARLIKQDDGNFYITLRIRSREASGRVTLVLPA